MRSFPSAVVMAVVLSLPVVPVLAQGEDHLHHRQHQVQHEITSTQQDADESSRRLQHATAALATAKAQLVTARSALAGARADLEEAKAVDARLQDELALARTRLTEAAAAVIAGQQSMAVQQQQVRDTVVSLYQQGPPQLLALSSYLDAQDPTDLTRRLEYSQTLVGNEAADYAALHAAEVLLRVRRTQVETAKEQVATQQQQAAAHVLVVQGLRDKAVAAKAAVQALVATRRDARQHARDVRRQDLATLHALKRQEARIKKLILAAAAKHRGQGYTGSDHGFLLRPVDGPVTSPYGWRIHPIYGYWGLHDGTDFGAGCGTPMHASADGRVISAYWSDVYGNRLYIDVGRVNGHDLVINYNHAERYVVSVGDHVSRGQTIGYVGTTGWSTGCHLHFTVLQDGTAVDPMTYIS